VEHFYRAIERPYVTAEEFEAQSIPEREVFTRHTLQLHVTDIAQAIDEHTFDARSNRYLVRVPLLVDEEGFDELAALHAEMYERTMDIQARSTERRAGSDVEGISTVSTSMFFETPEPSRNRK
ncbi:MAG TPA: hypothetical protein VIJ21_11765, partial [Solirubrobacterales bacterium]